MSLRFLALKVRTCFKGVKRIRCHRPTSELSGDSAFSKHTALRSRRMRGANKRVRLRINLWKPLVKGFRA